MATWQEFTEQAPQMAAAGLKLLEPGISYLATLRKDGSPRLHPVCPVLAGGSLFVAIPETSPKWRDLVRDGRFALHAFLGAKNDDELMLAGRAVLVEDAATRAAVGNAASHVIHDSDKLFDFHIDRVLTGYWEHVGQPNTRPIRQWWRAGGD